MDKKKTVYKCEDCLYFDIIDEESGEMSCTVSLDEDEMLGFMLGRVNACPYYRQYDEYKSVQKQN